MRTLELRYMDVERNEFLPCLKLKVTEDCYNAIFNFALKTPPKTSHFIIDRMRGRNIMETFSVTDKMAEMVSQCTKGQLIKYGLESLQWQRVNKP